MEQFVNQINAVDPMSVSELRALQGDVLAEALQNVNRLQLSCYMDETDSNLKQFKTLKTLELFHLSQKELSNLLLHLKTATLYWRSNGFPEWGIECLVIRECQSSPEISNSLCTLFSDSILKNLTVFHWITREKDKNSELGEKIWLRLCDSLRNIVCAQICSLRIPNNNIGEKGCKELARLCFDNKLANLRELDLSGNRIGCGGVTELMRAIHIVNLSQQITYLNISNNQIRGHGVKMMYDHMKMCDFPVLETLCLGDNMIGKKYIEMICDVLTFHALPCLRCLDFSGIKMGDTGMTGLAALLRSEITPNLQEVVLRDCGLNAQELEHLSYAIQDGFCMNLRRLDLSSNNMKSKGIVAIQRMLCKECLPKLEMLDLSDNRLGNQGIGELGNAADLNCMVQIRNLYLCHNQISDEGASCIYLYVRNKQWKSVEQLYLDDNNFSKISIIHLRSLVEMNNNLCCIYLDEMARQRDPYIHYEQTDVRPPRSVSVELAEGETEPTDEECLQEIFNVSTDVMIPPCTLKRTSDEKDQAWSPVKATMTPIPDSIGLGVDSELYSTPIA